MPKPAPAKKAAANVAAKKEVAKADAALDTKAPAAEEATEETTEEEVETETEATTDPATREAPAMEEASEPTDFDHLLDLSRAVDPKFGSEGAKEGTQHFMVRILSALADSELPQFETLPMSAQTWYENAVAQGNAKEDITPPDGYKAPTAVAGEVKKGAKKAAAKKEAAPKKAREPKPPKEKKEREASKTYPIRLLVCKNPAITLDELQAKLPSTGKSTLSTLRSDTLAALKAARECGWSAPA